MRQLPNATTMSRFAQFFCFATTLMLHLTNDVKAESFSCSYGRPACLDYGAKVCSSRAKCVADDAICFDSSTCGYQGFVCKSKLLEVADTYETLVRKYNELVEKHNRLVESYDRLKSDHDAVENDLQSAKDELEACNTR